jgi:hypothetical protein
MDTGIWYIIGLYLTILAGWLGHAWQEHDASRPKE